MFWEDVIYMDETTAQIETHRRTCYYKKGQKPRYKPKPKHRSIFEGKMNAPLSVMILEKRLV